MNMKRFFLIALFTGSALCSMAQSKVWTLNDCMIYAVERNPEARRHEFTMNDNKQSMIESALSALPSISAGMGLNSNYGRSIDPQTNIYSNTANLSNSYAIDGSLPLFKGFSIVNNIKISKIALLRGKELEAKIDDQIALNTMQAYYDLIFAYGAVSLAEEQLAENRKLLTKTHAEMTVGLKGLADVAPIAADVAAKEFNLIQQQSVRDMAMVKLKEQMYFPFEDTIVVDTLNVAVPIFFSEAENSYDIYSRAISFLPEAQIAEYNVRGSKLNLSTATASMFPNLSASGGYSTGFSKGLNDGKTYESFGTQMQNRAGEYLGMKLNIPIFNGWYLQANRKRSKNDYEREQITYNETLRKIESEIKQAVLDMQSAEKEYIQSQKREEASDISYTVMKTKYEQGLVSIIDLQTTSNLLLSARYERLNASLRYIIKRKVVDYYKGAPYIN